MTEEWTEADDIIEEIHEIRRQLWARFDNDIDRIAEHYMSLDKAQPERPIAAPPRPNPGKSAA